MYCEIFKNKNWTDGSTLRTPGVQEMDSWFHFAYTRRTRNGQLVPLCVQQMFKIFCVKSFLIFSGEVWIKFWVHALWMENLLFSNHEIRFQNFMLFVCIYKCNTNQVNLSPLNVSFVKIYFNVHLFQEVKKSILKYALIIYVKIAQWFTIFILSISFIFMSKHVKFIFSSSFSLVQNVFVD